MSLYWNPQEYVKAQSLWNLRLTRRLSDGRKLWYFSNRIFMLRPGVTWTWCWFFLPSDDSTGLPVVDPISIFTKGGIDEATFNACTVDIGLKNLVSESST